jgi:pimeloyl-ACP methyl ester carboxylesterase
VPPLTSVPPPDRRLHGGSPRQRSLLIPTVAAVVSDALAAGTLVRTLSWGTMRRRPWVRHDVREHGRRWPVILLHGFAGTDAVWDPLAEELCASGFGCVVRLSYNTFLTSATEVVRAVCEQVSATLELTGAGGVHLVGHSLGGLFLRRAVKCGTFDGPATVVSIATPYRGVRMARWLPGSCARSLAPAPAVVEISPRAHGSVRWITFSSDGDWWVPPSSARLPSSDPAVTNVDVPGTGHLTMCRHPGVIARVIDELLSSEQRAVGAGTYPDPAEAA